MVVSGKGAANVPPPQNFQSLLGMTVSPVTAPSMVS